MKKVKIISAALAWVILTSLEFIKTRFVDRIPDMDVRTGVLLLLNPVREMVKALSDEEPRNAEQVRELWRKFVNTDFSDFSQVQLEKLIGGVKNDRVRNVLSVLVTPSISLTRAYTDENPANDEQAREILNAFLENPDVHEVVLTDLLRPILEKTVKDPSTVAFILSLVAQALRQVGEGSLNSEQRAKVIALLDEQVKLTEAA